MISRAQSPDVWAYCNRRNPAKPIERQLVKGKTGGGLVKRILGAIPGAHLL